MTEVTLERSRSRVAWVWMRWPTWLALACAALTFGGGGGEEMVRGLAQFIVLLQLNYLVAAALDRRWMGWVGLPASFAITIGLESQRAVDPTVVLTGLALVVLVWGFSREHLRRSESFVVQAVGMAGFAAVALAALAVTPEVALYVTAVGWFLHGLWDFWHMWKDTVVSRSFAEWCGVVDILLAAELLLVR